MKRRYERLAERGSLVGVLGQGIADPPARGVRGAAIGADDPLRREWCVVVAGAQHLGALIAIDLGDEGPEDDRRFAFVFTHDTALVLGAARSLLHRIGPPRP